MGGWRRSGRRKHQRAALAAASWLGGAAGLLGAVLTGCSSGPPAPGATGTSCGTTRTGANVPVRIEVEKGTVACATVLTVDGRVRGNGGGAPVTVDGWTCQGYATPATLRTGVASECHTASAEVAAVLSSPTASSSPAPSGS
ncbi:MAG: hypothetical protein WAL12_13050 [Trebonia sp.]